MFDENFSFEPVRSPSIDSNTNTLSTRETSRSVSPCSPTGPFPPPRFSVTDLAASFASSRLRHDSQICYDSCDSYANMDDDAGWAIPAAEDSDFPAVSRSRTCPQRPHSPSRRLQRQVNTRMLCSMSHAKDIASLVSRMVDCKEQCTVVSPGSATPSIEEDEGYNSGETSMPQSRRSSMAPVKPRAGFEYRRSSDFKTAGAYVNKATRFRKDRKHKRIRSAESEA